MLSLSAENSGQEVNLEVINGRGHSGLSYGEELLAFAEALALREESQLAAARSNLLRAAGPEVLIDAAAVAGNFQRMVRIADSTGIPVDGLMAALSGDIAQNLDLHRFHSAGNTSAPSLMQKISKGMIRFLARKLLLQQTEKR